MKSDDPWKDVQPSPSEASLVGHLVLESRPHEVFRARDPFGRRMLFLVHGADNAVETRLPKLAGLQIEVRQRESDGRAALVVRLENGEDADVFARFCEDIVATVAAAESEAAAVQAFIVRTWKWHALLKGARKKTLSREDQLGLIGELHTLANVIAPTNSIGIALESWCGSDGAPKDFELAALCIESKARGAASREKVRITSEHQLADAGEHPLILLVHTFASAGKEDVSSRDLHQSVSLLRAEVSNKRPDLAAMLESKLEDAGYDDGHEYEVVVVHHSTSAFLVGGDFPRIVPGVYSEGPVEISYDLPLSSIAPFEITAEALKKIMLAAGEDNE